MKTLPKFKKLILEDEKGAALIYALMIFSVIFILSTSVLSLFSSNLFQAKYQEDKMESHYISYSGALMAFAAITEDSNELLDKIIKHNYVYTDKNINLGKGVIDIEAKKSKEADYLGWIEITSVATLTSEKMTTKSILYVNPLNKNEVKWKSL